MIVKSLPSSRHCKAPAKINLFLHVTGRRADGYHLLDSIFLFTDLADELSVTPAEDISLEILGPFAGNLAGERTQDNLIFRAARMLEERLGSDLGASISLMKNIPVAAGLGGGSTDAAATLRLLSQFWSRDGKAAMAASELHDLALQLGADIPSCLTPQPCRIGGVGERVTPLDGMPDWGLVLANPGVAVPTPAVFAARREADTPFTPVLLTDIPWTDCDWLRTATRNDLEPFAIAREPEIGILLSRMAALEGCRLARMSGSGATCFALFSTREEAARAGRDLRAATPGIWVWTGGFFAASGRIF